MSIKVPDWRYQATRRKVQAPWPADDDPSGIVTERHRHLFSGRWCPIQLRALLDHVPDPVLHGRDPDHQRDHRLANAQRPDLRAICRREMTNSGATTSGAFDFRPSTPTATIEARPLWKPLQYFPSTRSKRALSRKGLGAYLQVDVNQSWFDAARPWKLAWPTSRCCATVAATLRHETDELRR